MSKGDGQRDLALIRASGSTARVLNLALVHERFGETEEHRQGPLFHNQRLNRALIVKHTIRAHERDLFADPVLSATKIILPYASHELDLGGTSFMVDEKLFERQLRHELGHYVDPADHDADVELLRLLAGLPSFDPFLLRERLRHQGLNPARCYFDLSEADIVRMRDHVGGEIGQLVKLAFATGGADAGHLSQRLADKLMTDETATALDPLRETLRLSAEEYVEGVFAWKGFLYYRWLTQDLSKDLAVFRPRFAGLHVRGAGVEERSALARQRAEILHNMDAAAAAVESTLLQYGSAFASLTEGQPAAFRSFLLNAPAMFIPMGEAIGIIKHIESFWRFRFPSGSMPSMPRDEAAEVLHEFAWTLSGVTAAQKKKDIAVA